VSYKATVIKVMIASPSDVREEREIIREVIAEWNVINSEQIQILLMPVGWESHSYPIMGDRPQEIINYQLLKDCDLLVATFWTRFGSPTGFSPSGTVEEIEKHLSLGKPAMIYFSNMPVRPDSVDDIQYKALGEFKVICQKKGLIENYDSKDEFRDKFRRQLAQIVNDRIIPELDELVPQIKAITDSSISLSVEAKELLIEATKDKDGIILRAEYMGGMDIITNERNFLIDKSPRAVALWDSALRELEENGLIAAKSYKRELFNVTRKGYGEADKIIKA
jgi:hypothetical protein